MGVTIKEIAEMAGVHRSTVDKVLHNRPGVSYPVRQKIQKILDDCNYQANPVGKALKMQEKKLKVEVLLLEVDAKSVLKKGIEEELKKYNMFQVETEYRTLEYSDVHGQAKALEVLMEYLIYGRKPEKKHLYSEIKILLRELISVRSLADIISSKKAIPTGNKNQKQSDY